MKAEVQEFIQSVNIGASIDDDDEEEDDIEEDKNGTGVRMRTVL